MPDSILNSPITNPLLFRAAAALPAAGAWTTPLEVAVPYKGELALYCTYTRGALGGACDIQPEYSPRSVDAAGVEDWFMQTEYSAAVLAAGVDSQSRLQREYFTYGSTAAGAENFVVKIDIDATVERVRVRARESGVVATPGNLAIYGYAYSEQ